MAETTYSIGEVVRLLSPDCDVTESTLRFWEKMGLIASQRTRGGHRVFTEDDLTRIRIIKRLQTQRDMPLSKIAELCQSVRSTEELAAIADFNERFMRPLRYDPSFEPLTLPELAARTGLSPQTLVALQDVGAIRPRSVPGLDAPEEARFDEDSLRIAEIFRELSAYGVEPEDLRETCELTYRVIELQFRYFYEKLYPRIPPEQMAFKAQVLSELGRELFGIIHHQTYLAVGECLTREGVFDKAETTRNQKAKNS